jgi:hypothetical protein
MKTLFGKCLNVAQSNISFALNWCTAHAHENWLKTRLQLELIWCSSNYSIGESMNRTLIATCAGLSLGVVIVAFGATVKDWSDITSAENHTIESIKATEHAAANNHYDMNVNCRMNEHADS